MNKNVLFTKPIDIRIENNRRLDNRVRNAIDAIQTHLFDPDAKLKIFPVLLQHIQDISDSDNSVILIPPKDEYTALEQADNLHCIHNDDRKVFIDQDRIKQWVEKRFLPSRPVIYNHPIPKGHESLLLRPNEVSALIILPIVNRNNMQGVCILAKSKGSYSSELIRRLLPLLGSVVCALQSAESVKGNILSLDQKISDNRFLTTLLTTSPIAIIVVDESNNIVISNIAAHRTFCETDRLGTNECNPSLNSLSGKSIYELLPKYDNIFKWSNQKKRYGDNTHKTTPRLWESQEALTNKGSSFIVNVSVFRYTHASQRYTTLQIQDITALQTSVEEYQQASQQLNALTHLVPVGIIRIDTKWQCLYANDKWYELSGLNNEESRGTGWINALHSDDVKSVLEDLRQSLQAGDELQVELRLVSPLGQIRWMDFSIKILFDHNGVVQGFLGTFADITERILHQERLRHVAEYDTLTGLANRNLFQDRLQQAFYHSEREGDEITIFFLDLDGFKHINDTLGHDYGDKLLQQVAERLLNTLRRNDTVARFGGDEFVVLLSSLENEISLSHVAQKTINAISQPYSIQGHDIFITASLGVAIGTATNSSSEKILKQADAALYLAKAEGKNNYQFFNDELDKEAQSRITLTNQLRTGLHKNNYSLAYQPQATIKNDEIIGFEALLRFTDDQGRLVMPNKFIPLLEESGLIIDIGKWVIIEACKQLSYWQKQDLFPENGFLSINVSPRQLLDESFTSVIVETCRKFRIDPKLLVIEITESVIIDRPVKVQKAMHALKEIGVKLALDDFGTGYSSLSYLQRYPFDHIKIDKSFVADLITDENDAKITKAIIALARSLGLKITAEGVTNSESLTMLSHYGADYYQGHFLGKASHAESATTKMKSMQH